VEVGCAGQLGQDHLSVEDGGAGGQFLGGRDDRPVSVRPVEASPREGADAASVEDQLSTVAVVLHLVNPVAAFGRLLDKGRQHRLDKTQTQRHGTPNQGNIGDGRDPDPDSLFAPSASSSNTRPGSATLTFRPSLAPCSADAAMKVEPPQNTEGANDKRHADIEPL